MAQLPHQNFFLHTSEIFSQQVSHEMAGREHLHQISSPEVMSNVTSVQGHTEAAPHDMTRMQNSETIKDIAAPEVRTRVRSQEEDVVVLQSTFTQTYPVPEEPKKVLTMLTSNFSISFLFCSFCV